ncbi:MAG: cobalt ECF transporter T component CbiQ [Deltaproteobacteria bacterium]|nr:MAG: cobalt ECF transporter T component CbiQ [Deltaproteobacteria bacterium]
MFDREFFALGTLDCLSYRDSPIHRIDPRAQVTASLIYVTAVVSFPRYEVLRLLPLSFFPLLVLVLGDIPFRFVAKKILLVSPFALFIGIFNPLLDRAPAFSLFGVTVTAGWVSFASIMVKFTLTVSTALLLVATTSFPGICEALERMGFPRAFVTQLLFLYRFLFVLAEEAMRMVRARENRSFGGRGREWRKTVPLFGTLLVRSFDRAERVYHAMLSRGFQGKVTSLRTFRFSGADLLFLLGVAGGTLLLRFVDFPLIVGRWVLGG